MAGVAGSHHPPAVLSFAQHDEAGPPPLPLRIAHKPPPPARAGPAFCTVLHKRRNGAYLQVVGLLAMP